MSNKHILDEEMYSIWICGACGSGKTDLSKLEAEDLKDEHCSRTDHCIYTEVYKKGEEK